MPTNPKRKKDFKATTVRIVSLSLAVLMLLSVVMTAVWRW